MLPAPEDGMPDAREYQSVIDEAEQAARAGDIPAAKARLLEALVLQESALGSTHPGVVPTLNNLAVACETLSELAEAEQYYRRAAEVASSMLSPGDPLVITSRDNLQEFCAAHGRPLEDWPGLGHAPPVTRPDVPVLAPPVAPPPVTARAVAPPPTAPPPVVTPPPAARARTSTPTWPARCSGRCSS
jgi:hypothetical protein